LKTLTLLGGSFFRVMEVDADRNLRHIFTSVRNSRLLSVGATNKGYKGQADERWGFPR